jgi:O-antigen/teichoic acid export membrane protein
LLKILENADIKDILNKGFIYFILRVLASVIGYFYIWFITSFYGSDIYGLIALGFSLFLIISIFSRLGFDTNTVKVFSNKNNDSEVGIFFKSLFISFVASVLLAFIIYFFREYIVLTIYKNPKPELLDYLPWILAAIPFWNIALISSSYLRAKQKNNTYAFINNPSRFLFSTILILMIAYFINDDPIFIVIAHFFGVLITSIISMVLCLKEINSIKIKSKITSIRFIMDSYPMLLSSSMLILLGLMDTQVMGIYESNTNIAIYNVCLKLAALTTFSLQSINSILAPKIAKYYAEENHEYMRLIKFSTTLNFGLTILILLFIFIFHKNLLSFFGEEYLAGKIVLFIFCLGKIVDSFCGSVGLILQMIGKQKVYQNFVVIALVLNLILTFILTPIYGGIGAATSTIISMAFWNIASVVYLKYKMNIVSYFQPGFLIKSLYKNNK